MHVVFRLLLLTVGLDLVAGPSSAAAPPVAQGSRQRPRRGPTLQGVYRAEITPHWFAANTRFWYRNALPGGKKEFILVDVVAGKRQAAFDHAKLAAGLSRSAGTNHEAERLPFDRIEFVDEGKAIRFSIGGTTWKCDLDRYVCARTTSCVLPVAASAPGDEPEDRRAESLFPEGLAPGIEPATLLRRQRRAEGPLRSPDGKWEASIRSHDVLIRGRSDGKEVRLSKDGKEDRPYGMLSWSPDSKTLIAYRITPGERKQVHLIRSSPPGGGRARLSSRSYALPGDRFSHYELNLFDVPAMKALRPEVEPIDFGIPRPRWKQGTRRFTYEKVDRGHQRFRVIEIDAGTGLARTLIDERSRTFIWTAHAERSGPRLVTYLDRSDEMIRTSEQDGWRHLYLHDGKTGKPKNQITRGEWVVRGIDRIDEVGRRIWFRASGRNPGQDPYLIHHYRIDFDGTNLVALTEGDGTHAIQYSPDREYLIDRYERVDLPPVHELRRVSDGKRVCELEKADVSELKKTGWSAPEVFHAPGRDGKTEIWGLICRPAKFDPTKKYPVIEFVYAGPHDHHVPKRFAAHRRFASLTDLGFIVVQIDGMGTAHRAKAFHDVCWHNLKDAGFPDRIAWHQAVARKYPSYDTSRVGIYGTSAGGQNAMGALLFHGDFYKAAVAACGCHDNRMDKASWNEQWMGYPVGKHYAASSNVDHAHRLQGKLLLIVGEVDENVPPESTYRVVDALIRAGKDFDLLVMPNVGHSDGGVYGQRRLCDFFVRHLHGVAPPDRNLPAQRRAP